MATLFIVLFALGDPRSWTLPAEALGLLEPLPPGPELAGALTEVAALETIQGRPEDGLRFADRALALGEELGLERSARPLGFRGMARGWLGDPGGLEDIREAITLATQAGQGREVALLHQILGMLLWAFEGPEAALEVVRAGVTFAQARGLAEMLDALTATTIAAQFDRGELDEALEVAAGAVDRLENEDVMSLAEVRATQARILALRGQAAQVAGSLDWLESTSRGTGTADWAVEGLGCSALARAGLGQKKAAAALLAEIEATPGAREANYYPFLLPAMVRTALGIGDQELAGRLVAGVEPRYPVAEHALVAANAALTEAREDLEAAAEGYADSVDRWERFGVVPERAFALLGQGRCLVGLARPTGAAHVLQQAREIFERLGAAPALAETDALLEEATPLSS